MPKIRHKSTAGKSSDGLPKWWKAYFTAIAQNGGFKGAAADAVGIHRSTPTSWLDDNPDYRDRYEKDMASAMDQAAEVYMQEVKRRGQEGILKPVFYQGKQVAEVREYSDTLLMFRLNAMGQGTRQSAVSFDAARLFTDDVLQALSPEHLRRLAAGEDPLLVMAALLSTKTTPE